MKAQGAITLGCGIEGLRSLHPESCALLLSDLPSGETQAPFDVQPNLAKFWPAAWAALQRGGVVCVMASSLKFATKIIASEPRAYRYDLIWRKSLPTGHLNARHRPLRAHEFVLVFAREVKHTYNPQRWDSAKPIHAALRTSNGVNYGTSTATHSRAGATDRFPVSVLSFASVGTSSKARVHPQQKPEDLLRYLIRTYSAIGGLVIDPYAGSGSTGRAALAEGRTFVGWDINPLFGGRSL